MSELGFLAAEIGVDERTLRRAVSQGSLRGHRPTPRTLQLSLAERRYIRRSWPLLSRLRRALRTEHNVRLAVLFGSVARGTDTPASDIDLVVVMRDAHLERVVDLADKLSAIAGRRVDIVRLGDAELQPSFLADIAADGRVLVDREQVWPRLRADEPELRRRARTKHEHEVARALAGVDRLLGR